MNKLLGIAFIILISCKNKRLKSNQLKYIGIERTLSLLKDSRKKDVNILFYGQSITGGMSSSTLVNSLRKLYPNANIKSKNKSIGGFRAPMLLKTAMHDVYHENPDLIVFHAYGGIENRLYDSLIGNIRKKLSADILLFDHHYIWTKPEERLQKVNQSHSFESAEIKKIAEKYDCHFVNVREQWGEYLSKNNIKPQELIGNTIDPNVHPNEKGNKLLRKIIFQEFKDNEFDDYKLENDSLRKQLKLDYNTSYITDTFYGNRLEIEFDSVEKNSEIEVIIDDKRPSEILSNYYITRPSKAYKSWMPSISQITFGNAFPKDEKWTIAFTEVDRNKNAFKYVLYGDKTGFDGEGISSEDFTSNSGRIVLKKKDFMIFNSEKILNNKTPENFKIYFEVKKIVSDTIKLTDKIKKHTLYRGDNPLKHTLKLKILKGSSEIKNITSYTPYLN